MNRVLLTGRLTRDPEMRTVANGKTVTQAWFMNTTFGEVPVDFLPLGETPLADFLAKVVGLKYVVDAGTPHARTFVLTSIGDLGTLENTDGLAVAQPLTLGTVRPLSVGRHTVDSYFSMRALHCDGFGVVIGENCLPPGDTKYEHIEFEVHPRSARH